MFFIPSIKMNVLFLWILIMTKRCNCSYILLTLFNSLYAMKTNTRRATYKYIKRSLFKHWNHIYSSVNLVVCSSLALFWLNALASVQWHQCLLLLSAFCYTGKPFKVEPFFAILDIGWMIHPLHCASLVCLSNRARPVVYI